MQTFFKMELWILLFALPLAQYHVKATTPTFVKNSMTTESANKEPSTTPTIESNSMSTESTNEEQATTPTIVNNFMSLESAIMEQATTPTIVKNSMTTESANKEPSTTPTIESNSMSTESANEEQATTPTIESNSMSTESANKEQATTPTIVNNSMSTESANKEQATTPTIVKNSMTTESANKEQATTSTIVNDSQPKPGCEASCRPLQMAFPGKVDYRPRVHPGDPILAGTEAWFSCTRRHSLHPDSATEAVCQEDGTWSQDPSQCMPDECGKIRYLRHGNVKINEGRNKIPLIGDVATYSCKRNYKLVPNIEHNTCLPGGEWEFPQPVCTKQGGSIERCPSIPFLHGQARMRGQERIGRSVTFTCFRRYALAETNATTLSCGPDGKWNGHIPHCRNDDCPRLVLANGHADYDPVKRNVGSLVHFRCDSGYELIPPEMTTIECLRTGLWSDAFPVCVKLNCDRDRKSPACQVPEVINGYVTGSGEVGHDVDVRCNQGYLIYGKQTIKCLENGEWEASFPSCERDRE